MADFAGVGSRVVGAIIDIIILAVIIAIIAVPLGLLAYTNIQAFSDPMAIAGMAGSMAIYYVLSLLIMLGYFTYFEGTSGQTLGKKLIGIKVVKEDGKAANMTDAFLRTLLRLIDALPFLYLIGFILILATEKKQRIGDMVAKTIVVKA